MPKIAIELRDANDDQRSRFDKHNLPATLDAIRQALGDPSAEVVITWLNHGRVAERHFVQSLSDFPPSVVAEFAGTSLLLAPAPLVSEPTNTWTPQRS